MGEPEKAEETPTVSKADQKKIDKDAKAAKKKQDKIDKDAAKEAAKVAKVKQPEQNGVTQPKDGTKTGQVWAIANGISEKAQKPATRKEVLEECTKAGINAATAATQYGRWRKFHGLGSEPKAVKPTEAAA